MWMNNLFLGMAFILAGCVRSPNSRTVPLENDRSVVFPSFFEHAAIEVGSGQKPYELDGVLLRAIMIAANDFIPPSDEERPCWGMQEAYRYRVLRQGNIIFVHISEDLEYCGMQYISVDTGAKYAISTDGRILRRLLGTEPDGTFSTGLPDTLSDADGGFPGAPPEQQDGGIERINPNLPPPSFMASDGGADGYYRDAG